MSKLIERSPFRFVLKAGRERVREALSNRPRLTLRGRSVLACSLAALAVGLLSANVVLVQLSVFFLLLTPIAILASHINLKGVTYDHILPGTAHRNESFAVEMRVENAKPGLGAFDVEVQDRAVFGHRTQPTVFSVGPCSSHTRVAATRFLHRGIYDGFDYSLSSRFPLGLAENRRAGRIADCLTICPWSRRVPDVTPLLEAGVGHGGLRNRVSSDFVGEFMAMREYRTGDHPKRISWPFSVRFQKLIVKETEQPCPRNVSVLFHSFEPTGVVLSRRSFENALELLAGLFEHLRESFIPVDFRASFNNWQRIATGAASDGHVEFAVLLATARMKVSRDIGPLVHVMRSEKRSSVVQLVVSNTPLRFWIDLLPQMHVPVFCMDNTGEVTGLFEEARAAV